MRPKRKDRHFRFAAFAVIPVCLLAMVMIINVVQAATVSGRKSTADAVTLEVSGDVVKVAVTVDNARDEKLTAVSLALDVNVKNGENTADFSFAETLKDTVYGSRYEENTLYLYVAGQDVIFDENDTVFLGELSLGGSASTDALSATVSYKEGSLEVANSAFGSRALLTVKSEAVSVGKENTTTQPETTTEKPGEPETTTEKPSQPETTTEKPGQTEATTEKPSQPETTTEKPGQTETTASGNKQPETTTGNSNQTGTTAADNRQQETTTSANKESETTTSANRQSETTTAVNQGNVQPTTSGSTQGNNQTNSGSSSETAGQVSTTESEVEDLTTAGSTQSETTVQNPESTQETDTTAQEKTSEEIQMTGKNNASSFGGIKLVLILAAVVVVLVGAGFVLYLNLKK